jgi:hypothetical protein
MDALLRLQNAPLALFQTQGAEWAVRSGDEDFPWDAALERKPVLNLTTWSPTGSDGDSWAHLRKATVRNALMEIYKDSPLTNVLIHGVSLSLSNGDCCLPMINTVQLSASLGVSECKGNILSPLFFVLSCCSNLQSLDLRSLYNLAMSHLIVHYLLANCTNFFLLQTVKLKSVQVT